MTMDALSIDRETCKHCDKPIQRYVNDGVPGSWFHINTGAVPCAAKTKAEPK